MTFGFDFHPEARAELFADVDWYDEREAGVGERFEAAVRAAIDAAVESPESCAVWPGWESEPVVRTKGVRDFPYRVVFFVRDDLLTIVAVAHASVDRAIGASVLRRPEPADLRQLPVARRRARPDRLLVASHRLLAKPLDHVALAAHRGEDGRLGDTGPSGDLFHRRRGVPLGTRFTVHTNVRRMLRGPRLRCLVT
jgi:toxin ParE1/3/4